MCCELIVHSASVMHQMWCKSNEPSWCPIMKSDIPQSVTSSRVKVPYILTDRLTDFSGDESDGFLVRGCLRVCVFLLNTCIIGETISLPSNWESAAMSYPLVQLSANKWCERVCAELPPSVWMTPVTWSHIWTFPQRLKWPDSLTRCFQKFAGATWHILVYRPTVASVEVWMCLGLYMS